MRLPSALPVRTRAAYRLRDLRRCPELLIPSTTRVGYVGWVGHGNAGDEAILAAYRRALPGRRVVGVPPPRLLEPIRTATRNRVVGAAALGGGNLIGWPLFRRNLEGLLAIHPSLPAFTLGTGVEDPEVAGRNPILAEALARAGSSSLRDELARWAEPLSRLDSVVVRGERSRELLAEMGIRAQVTGDPALLLADPSPAPTFSERLLGLNIGHSEALPRADLARIFEAVVEAGRAFSARGWRVRLVPLSPDDDVPSAEAARMIGRGVEVVDRRQGLSRILAGLRDCHALVGQKLHSIVLAAAVYLPAVSIEYHPKCREFQRSLGREEFVLAVDGLRGAAVETAVEELAERREHHAEQVFSGVSAVRARLETHVGTVRSSLAAC